MGEKPLRLAESERPASRRIRLRAIAPVGVLVAVAVLFAIVPVVSSAYRADSAAADQERRLLSQALKEKQERLAREVEFIASSKDAAAKLWLQLDEAWVHQQIGLRLRDQLENTSVLLVDPASGFVHTLAGQLGPLPDLDGKLTLQNLAALISRLRTDAAPRSKPALASSTQAPSRVASGVQRFMDVPAIVAVAPLAVKDLLGREEQRPPVIAIVYAMDNPVLNRIASRLELSRLQLDDPADKRHAHGHFDVLDQSGQPVARLSWEPKRPGAGILAVVLPFVALALAGLIAIAVLAVRYLRRASQAVAEGETQLLHLANHDPLSGLLNRPAFAKRLDAELARRGRNSTAALLCIDLDHFKAVNDTLGYATGDALLKITAKRLQGLFRDTDAIARLGADSFAIMVCDSGGDENLQRIATRTVEALGEPYSLNGNNVAISASIGVVELNQADDSMRVIRFAEIALERAKAEGRNRFCRYDSAADADLTERKRLESDLRAAIAAEGLAVAYQPIVTPDGERIVGVEALCRWQHPVHGFVSPLRFIEIAEQSDMIADIGEWILRRACRDAKAWPDITLAVNVSPLQFRRVDFASSVERILAQTGFNPRRLELELTESTLLRDGNGAQETMKRLKAFGVQLVLDDFGTGYSSLLYLRTFPFDRLKIDRSFIASIETETEAAAIIHAIVSLGRGIGMKVTAEGVETSEQQLFLRAAGVHCLQGFRFGKPMSADEISARLARHSARQAARSAIAG
jgi:diguanylate cyclase